MTPGTVSQMSPLAGGQVLVFGSLCPVGIQLKAQEDRIVQAKKGVAKRLLLNTRVPGFVGRFFNCQGDESLGPVPFSCCISAWLEAPGGGTPHVPLLRGKSHSCLCPQARSWTDCKAWLRQTPTPAHPRGNS